MTQEQAEKHLAEDDPRWLLYQDVGILSEEQRRHGPPYFSTPEPKPQVRRRGR